MFLIYKYTNLITNKIYIGQTSTSLKERSQSNGSNYKGCPLFYSAIKKYGWDSFSADILDEVDTQEEANKLEEYYIKYFNSTDRNVGYNIAPGGGAGVMSEGTRLKISKSAKERYRDKTKNPMYGKKHSIESLEKMRNVKIGSNNPMYGSTWTEAQRLRCGTKGKKLNLSDEAREALRQRFKKIGMETGLKPVRCIEDGIMFNSITEAASHYGVATSTLSGHLSGRQHSSAGKHFEFVK